MNRTLFALGVLALAGAAQASELANVDGADSRFLFDDNATSSLSVSLQNLAIGLFALLALGLLFAVLSLFLFSGGEETGYSGSSASSYGSYGSARAAASADPYSAIWEKMSVLDWIAMAEEVYRNFDATSMDCQKRLVCELHQNENSWGTTARKMNDAFSYLQYMELLNLPSEMRLVLDEYMDAANKGRTSQKTCEEEYNTCQFSVKSLITKYNGSNAI